MADEGRIIKISRALMEKRAEQVMNQFASQIDIGLIGQILGILYPEEYGSMSSQPNKKITALPNTVDRLDQIQERVADKLPLLIPGDRQATDHIGWLADSAVIVEADGTKKPSGKGAGGARCRGDLPVDRQYIPLCGNDRPTLPEVGQQKWKEWQKHKNARESTPEVTGPPKIDPIRFGERVRYFRTLRNLKLRQLAKKSGVAFSTVWRIEMGKHRPGQQTIEVLAWALRLTHDELLGPR